MGKVEFHQSLYASRFSKGRHRTYGNGRSWGHYQLELHGRYHREGADPDLAGLKGGDRIHPPSAAALSAGVGLGPLSERRPGCVAACGGYKSGIQRACQGWPQAAVIARYPLCVFVSTSPSQLSRQVYNR